MLIRDFSNDKYYTFLCRSIYRIVNKNERLSFSSWKVPFKKRFALHLGVQLLFQKINNKININYYFSSMNSSNPLNESSNKTYNIIPASGFESKPFGFLNFLFLSEGQAISVFSTPTSSPCLMSWIVSVSKNKRKKKLNRFQT